MPITTIHLFSSNSLLILKCYNNVFPVCHIFKHTLDYFLCILVRIFKEAVFIRSGFFLCFLLSDR